MHGKRALPRFIVRLAAALILVGALLVGIVIFSTYRVGVTEVELEIAHLPEELDGLRVLHLTDWHNPSPERVHVDVLGALDDREFDLVCLTGDLVDSDVGQLGPVIEVLEQLGQRAPVVSVLGNHDWYAGGAHILDQLRRAGIITLENASASIPAHGVPVTVVGISDHFSGRDDVAGAFSGVEEPFVLAITHDPRIFPGIASRGPSLVLAGHTHGGQIRLPFLPTQYAPGGGILPRFGDGLYRDGDSFLYVSRGIGYTGTLPFRFWNRPEITLLTLRRR